jgi:plasmid stabilization system protein ParE
MRARLRLSNEALADLTDIWAYTAEAFGESQALTYDVLLRQAIEDLTDEPMRAGSKTRSISEVDSVAIE